MTALPNRRDLAVALSRFRDREELGVPEAITAVEALVIPLLGAAGHNTADLADYASKSALGPAWRELDRFIKLEGRDVLDRLAVIDSADAVGYEALSRSAALIQLMRLLVGARIHMYAATV